MWQILFFALPPKIKAPKIKAPYQTNGLPSNKMKYYNQPVNRISIYIKTSKHYKTYK